MPTAIVQDGVVHTAHPDEDGMTFCGEEWSHDSADRIVSKAVNARPLVRDIEVEEDDAYRCYECLDNGEEWATPEEKLQD